MKLSILALMLLAGLIGCSSMNERDNSYHQVLGVINEYSKELHNTLNIDRTWYGIGYGNPQKKYDGKIYQISLGYRCDRDIKPTERRELFYKVVDGLLAQINQNKEIAKYFHHSPIGYEDLHICLSFDYENTGRLKKNEIHSIHIQFNEIFYEIVDQDVSLEVKKRILSPDIYIMDGYTSPYRCISRPVSDDLLLQNIEG